MTDASAYPAQMRFECRACEREFIATGRTRVRQEYCDEHCRQWANTKTGKRLLAERQTDPPIPEDAYRRFPILGQMAQTNGDALAAWATSCDCLRCTILRAAYPAPHPVKIHRRPKINLALGPRYPCGHPRNLANSVAAHPGSSQCRTCKNDHRGVSDGVRPMALDEG
jgi:hypothetical protein